MAGYFAQKAFLALRGEGKLTEHSDIVVDGVLPRLVDRHTRVSAGVPIASPRDLQHPASCKHKSKGASSTLHHLHTTSHQRPEQANLWMVSIWSEL